MNPKISIIVPVYNAEKYLEKCILSILEQTYSNIELILVNDGSHDHSHEICIKYQSKDNVLYILKENGGASSARNMGLKSATGKYVAFIDADDFISKTMMEELQKAVANENAQVACCGFKKYFDETHVYDYTTINVAGKDSQQIREMIFDELIGGRGCGSPVCKLYDMNIIRENHISFNETISNNEDVLFNLSYFKVIDKAAFINSFPYYYRKGQESLSSGYIRNWKELIVKIFNEKKNILGNQMCSQKDTLLQHSWFLLNLIGVINEVLCKDRHIEKNLRKQKLNWYLNNIKQIRNLQNVIYHAYTYPERRINFKRIYPVFAYFPIKMIQIMCNLIITIR